MAIDIEALKEKIAHDGNTQFGPSTIDVDNLVACYEHIISLAFLELRGPSHVHLERQEAAEKVLMMAPELGKTPDELREYLGLPHPSPIETNNES